MKKVLVCMLMTTSFFCGTAQTKSKVAAKPVAAVKAPFKNLLDSFSYAAGYVVANNMKQQNVRSLNSVMMQKAIDDVFKNKQPQLNQDQITAVLQKQSQLFAEEKSKQDKAGAAPEIAKGVAFLDANKKRPGVTTLPNGLQYEVIKKADNATVKPGLSDTVVVNYIGTLIDGKEFDNSYKRGAPAEFPLKNVIRGWTEILQLMSAGDKWKVYIPTELAYNLNPPTPEIPQGAALVFEISLEGIKPAAKQ